MIPSHASRSRGFTIVELLVVITIIVVLAALIFPLVSNFKRKAQAVDSLNRIKQCGAIVFSRAADTNNVLQIHVSGTSSGIQDLRLYGMVEESIGTNMVGKLVYTPAYEKKASGTWPVWAVNIDSNPDMGITWKRISVERQGTPRNVETLRLATCVSPERYPLFADSSSAAGDPRTGFGNDNTYKFAMRYGSKGPIFFLDGSAGMVGLGEMAKYGIKRGFVFKDDPTIAPTLVTANVTP
ncbi:MAG: type II secretion system GspH family protein [Akkermansiaceae bacterium]|nr:type II secretion system GspH family protein [Akkermansiaceae bacterium]